MGYIKQAVIFIFCSLLLNISFAQEKKYDSLWAKVERLSTTQGLTTTALGEVKKIYALAKKENNNPQLIKALIYQANLSEGVTEDAQAKNISELETELKTTKEPARS